MSPLKPGSAIGIVGGGQLGRMLAMAAARLGYRTIILEPDEYCPAEQVASSHITAAYDDAEALETLAALCDVVTYEFENVPIESARILTQKKPVFPPPRALEVAQDRLTEKTFLNDCGIATAEFAAVDSQEQLEQALDGFGGSGVLKTRRLGYDGKGQRVFKGADDNPAGAFGALGHVPLILERLIPFTSEISVIAARAQDGAIAAYDPARNEHQDGILRWSSLPCGAADSTVKQARHAAEAVLRNLDYVGIMSSASSSSSSKTAACWPTNWRRVSTIPDTGRRLPARSPSSNSTSAPSLACRWARSPATSIAAWKISSATTSIGSARFCRSRTLSCTSTANGKSAWGARWGMSPGLAQRPENGALSTAQQHTDG